MSNYIINNLGPSENNYLNIESELGHGVTVFFLIEN